ncbi:MAG: AAA family ATPase [bacterium]
MGCSTVALNIAVALAECPSTRALLMDFDLSCGMIGFLMHARTDVSIVEAAEHAAELHEELWPRLVENRGALDIIPSGALRPNFRIEPAQVRYLLDFARRNYDVICVDLSGLMERYSVELMQESRRIYLVCTPELPSIYLARQKLDFLRTLELEDRVRVLLNREQKHSLVGPEGIEKIIGLPVAVSFPNDYRGVHRAVTDGKPVERRSDLGKRFAALARGMMGSEAKPARARRFVDYFTLNPARFTLEGDGHSRGAA